MAGTFLWNFIEIRLVVSEKMFKEKVNAQTDARTDGRTTDHGPWHKLTGLRPMELKTGKPMTYNKGHFDTVKSEAPKLVSW